MVSTLNSSSFRSTSVGFLSRNIQRFPKINYGPEELESLFTERSIASLSSPLMIKCHHGLPKTQKNGVKMESVPSKTEQQKAIYTVEDV